MIDFGFEGVLGFGGCDVGFVMSGFMTGKDSVVYSKETG